MPQDDQSVANASGATVRADINSQLQALATLSSGASAPATTWPNQWWMDTTANILKQRDNANTAWVNVASKVGSVWIPYRDGTLLGDMAEKTAGLVSGNGIVLGTGGFLPAVGGTFGRGAPADKTTNYAIVAGDVGQIIPFDCTAAGRVPTLPLLSSVGEGFSVGVVRAAGANTITVNEHATDGGATIATISSDNIVWISRVSGAWAVVGAESATLTGISSIERIRKSANETVNNSTTIQNDDHLLASLSANEQITFKAIIMFTGNATADIKFAFTVPTGATIYWKISGNVTGADAGGEELSYSGSAAASTGIALLDGVVENGANAGNLQLQWAQNTATVVDTIVLEGSRLTVWRE